MHLQLSLGGLTCALVCTDERTTTTTGQASPPMPNDDVDHMHEQVSTDAK